MDRIKLIDDIRTKALSFMSEDPNLTYDVASMKAKKELTGEEMDITRYHQGVSTKESIVDIAKKELSPNIRIDLYREDQLKEMIVANRLGVDIESFVSIFLTPEQIHFITLASLKGEDVTKYVVDLGFNPEEEMKRLMEEETKEKKGYQKVYSLEAA